MAAAQLTLQSFEGLDRGANKAIVYYPERAFTAQPTRMFQDAQTTARWQSQFGFFPVVDRGRPDDLSRSVLWRFLVQRAEYPGGTHFDVDTTVSCPRAVNEVEREFQDHPERGMPFGFPVLSSDESATIAAWLHDGAGRPPSVEDQNPVERAEIAKWEGFLNDSDARTPLVSAYLFEHLFYAHLHFDAVPGAWFRVVRSRTPSPASIDEIATRRPYDDPGAAPFFYRLRQLQETLVLKTHAPYALNDAKLARLRQLFFEPAWTAPAALPYDRKRASNPFLAFAAIPARARYQFLLDDARYHVQTFIHGPVCRGQAALDVIDEQFLIFFLAPEIQWLDVPLSTDPTRARFEQAMRELVRKPAPYVAVFPDAVLLRLRVGGGSDLVYTLARNRVHKSVEFIFLEGVELEPAEDHLQIVSGIATGRPNFFLSVDAAQLDAFVATLQALKSGDSSWRSFVAKYGVRRSDPAFWSTFDFFAQTAGLDPIGAAVLDLSRYTND